MPPSLFQCNHIVWECPKVCDRARPGRGWDKPFLGLEIETSMDARHQQPPWHCFCSSVIQALHNTRQYARQARPTLSSAGYCGNEWPSTTRGSPIGMRSETSGYPLVARSESGQVQLDCPCPNDSIPQPANWQAITHFRTFPTFYVLRKTARKFLRST